ncbi:MAG: hypothetical protein LBU69_06085, partial [Deltaproteobacteria bacterium]|nr:hypothetical protein [Deltaproteobacteria bacterium]
MTQQVIENAINSSADKLNISPEQFLATLELLKANLPVPFIARYRKEETGGLDEEKIIGVRDAHEQFERLNRRVDSMLNSLEDRGLLSPEIEELLLSAKGFYQLEDYYLPYRPFQLCLANRARSQGLEPLAEKILAQNPDHDPEMLALEAIDEGAKVDNINDALLGASHLISEKVFFDLDTLDAVRDIYRDAMIYVTPREEKLAQVSEENVNFQGAERDDSCLFFSDKVQKLSSGWYFSMKLDEARGLVDVEFKADEEFILSTINELFLKDNGSQSSAIVSQAIYDAYHYLLAPRAIHELKEYMHRRAQPDVCRLLAKTLKEFLNAPPLRGRNVMAV